MKNLVPRYAGLLILAVLVSLLAACTSAEELMDDGAKLESEGRYEEALRKYIRAYDKNPEIADLEPQIIALGNRVVADLLADADVASNSDNPVAAAETYMRIDELVLRAFEVGIGLDRPSDYRERRYAALRLAVAFMLDNARYLHDAGDFAGSDAVYRQALDRFNPTAEEATDLLIGRYEVLLDWADRATAAGRYREATKHADQALAVANDAGVRPDDAIAIRTRAIELGTLYVVAAPIRARQRVEDEMSPWFLNEINDRLELDFWSQPPEFVAMAHGALTRQRLRQLGLSRRPLSNRDARRLAVDLDADLTVSSEIEQFASIERNVSEHPRKARTRNGEDVSYMEVSGKLEIETLVRVVIVTRNGDVIFDDHLKESRQRDFRRVEFDGNFRDLDLSGDDRRLFDREQYDDVLTQLEEDLAARISDRIARTVFDRLLREVR